jgi:hypothetical protein
MSRAMATCAAVLSLLGSLLAQQQTFRTATDAVLVDVSIMAHGQAVPSLGRADFTLMDSGVSQEIDDVGVVSLPIDLSLLIETGSEARFLGLSETIQHDATLVQSLLQSNDRGSLVTVDSQIRLGQSPGDPSLRGERGTPLLDAVCAALMARVDPGRRHVVVVISAGIDTHSLIPPSTRTRILSKAESPVYFIGGPPIQLDRTSFRPPMGIIATPSPANAAAPFGEAVLMADYSAPLHAIVDSTGGKYFELRKGDAFLEPLKQAIDAFRTQYVIRYRPKGVNNSGWHPLLVKLTRIGDYEIRARKGYWRD